MAAMPMRKLRLWQDKIETEVAIFGSGPPLVFLHGSWGLRNDQEFLELLARTHTVYAPKHPGTSEGDSEAVHQIDDWWDLIVYHGELLDRLELKSPVLVGHSFGGLVACEIAAAMPERVEKARSDRPGRTVARRHAGQELDAAVAGRPARGACSPTPKASTRKNSSNCRATPRSASMPKSASSGRKPAPANSSGRSPTKA